MHTDGCYVSKYILQSMGLCEIPQAIYTAPGADSTTAHYGQTIFFRGLEGVQVSKDHLPVDFPEEYVDFGWRVKISHRIRVGESHTILS